MKEKVESARREADRLQGSKDQLLKDAKQHGCKSKTELEELRDKKAKAKAKLKAKYQARLKEFEEEFGDGIS